MSRFQNKLKRKVSTRNPVQSSSINSNSSISGFHSAHILDVLAIWNPSSNSATPFIKIFKSRIFWSILILILAGIFRLSFMNLIEFKYDEANTFTSTLKFLTEPYLITNSGISSTGMNNFPLFYYLTVLLVFFARDPQSLSLLFGVIATIFVPIFYLIVRKYYSNSTAIISSLFLALSPWSIIYSRKIWGPDLIWIFIIPIFYLLHRLIISKNQTASFWLSLLLVLLTQLHLSGIFLILTTALIFGIFRIRFNYFLALLGISIGLIPVLPYVIYQFADPTTFCPDCTAFFDYQKFPKPFDLKHLVLPFQITGGWGIDNLLGQDYDQFLNTYPLVKLINLVYILELILPLAGVIFILKKLPNSTFIVLYALLMPALYFFTKTPGYIYYYVILTPFLFVLYALSFEYASSFLSKIYQKILIYSVLFLLLLSNIIFQISFFHFLATKQRINGDYGPIYSVTQQLVDQSTSKYQNLPNYQDIQTNALLFAASPAFYAKMGEYFGQNNQPTQAAEMFQKAIQTNPQDLTSQANLIYIYIKTSHLFEAQIELDSLSKKESQFSPKLQQLLDQAQANQ